MLKINVLGLGGRISNLKYPITCQIFAKTGNWYCTPKELILFTICVFQL